MITGQQVIESFDWAYGEADLPLFSAEDGEPTGETAHYHIVAIVPQPGMTIELRFGEEAWQTYIAKITGRQILPASPGDIAKVAEEVGALTPPA